MKDAILSVLQNDMALGALLSGGVHSAVEISRTRTPAAFDANGELQPCALVTAGMDDSLSSSMGTVQTSITIYVYEPDWSSVANAATDQIYTLLHDQQIHPENGRCVSLEWQSDDRGQWDAALEVNMAITTFVAKWVRK